MRKSKNVDKDRILKSYLMKDSDKCFRDMPVRHKNKIIVLEYIISFFDKDRHYTEKEVNELLSNIYYDYVELRRSLIDYKLLERLRDGSSYWVRKDL